MNVGKEGATSRAIRDLMQRIEVGLRSQGRP